MRAILDPENERIIYRIVIICIIMINITSLNFNIDPLKIRLSFRFTISTLYP